MPRYFLKKVGVESFRGINNDGEPLVIAFKTNAVNSLYAANAQGKSSVFDALCYAIKGQIPKLDDLPAADQPDRYYSNLFHSSGDAEINLTLEADDGSGDVSIRVRRLKDSTREVDSPSGFPDPEKLLADLDNSIVLLDNRTFLQFVEDTPLSRGRTFSALLGLARLSQVRQVLEMFAHGRTLNNDFDISGLETSCRTYLRQLVDLEKKIGVVSERLTGQRITDSFDLDRVVTQSSQALESVDLLRPHFDGDLLQVDFDLVREAIRDAERGDEREILARLVTSLSTLNSLDLEPAENDERDLLSGLVRDRALALSQTRGLLMKQLYDSVAKVLQSEEWDQPDQCPACETTLDEPLAPRIEQLRTEYAKMDRSTQEISSSWKASAIRSRLISLRDNPELSVTTEMVEMIARLDASLLRGDTDQSQLREVLTARDQLENDRKTSVASLETKKTQLEKSLPPSLVQLSEQVGYGEQLKEFAIEYNEIKAKLPKLKAKLEARYRWQDFITQAKEIFSEAEVQLSTLRTQRLERQYQSKYAEITKNPEVVPVLRKAAGSEELRLLLKRFYGLEDISATTVLAESYRNALAISIFLSAALEDTSSARFIVLDDVTSSFDAGHQFAIMELIHQHVARPGNPNGPQVIILSHDGLLQKYFDQKSGGLDWHHQRMTGLPPRGTVFAETQDANRLRANAERFLKAGQVDSAAPLVRQYLEFKLLEVIRKVDIRVPLDFSIRDDRKMVQNCLNAIRNQLELTKQAGSICLTSSDLNAVEKTHVPALISNWLNHYSTATISSVSPYVLLGVLGTIDDFADCFRYDCSCSGMQRRRYYKSLTEKHCGC